MISTSVAISTGDLHYLDSQGAGATVVLAHGNSSAAAAFEQQFAVLGDHYRLLAVDLPGHGASSPARQPEQAYGFSGYARALVEFVERLGLSEFFLVGHSLGGHAAIEALPQLPGARGLVLIGAPPFNPHSAAATFLAEPTGGLVFQAELSAREVAVLSAAFVQAARLPSGTLERLGGYIRATDPRVRACLGASLGSGAFADELAILRAAQLPVLLAQGCRDAFIDAAYCASGAAFAGCNLRLSLFEDCGHCPHLEDPHRFNDLLQTFISQVSEKAL